MKNTIISSAIIISLFCVNQYALAGTASTNVHVDQVTSLTKFTSETDVTITESDIANSRNGGNVWKDLGKACLHTNEVNGRANLTITADSNHSGDEKAFALYNASLGKVPVGLYVGVSPNYYGGYVNGVALKTSGLSDNEASADGCPNQDVNISMRIIPSALKNAKAGTYTLQYTLSADHYTG